jgi:hypothetical protein
VNDSWDPPGVPQAGDQVVIASGAPRIKSGDPPLDELHVTLGTADFAQPASIKAFGATFGSGFAIHVPPSSPYAALYFEESPTFDGTLTAVGGQLSIEAGKGFQGSGQTYIEKGATVTFTGAVPEKQTVTFGDANGTLALNDPSKFLAQITGVRPGDRIVLGRLEVAVSTSYAHGELRIEGELGGHIATLKLLEAVSPLYFYATPSGNRGSTLSTSRQHRSWGGGSGDWYDSARWENGVSLGGDTVSIPSGTVVLSEADATRHGVLDTEDITLGKAGSCAPVTLETTTQHSARRHSSGHGAVRNTPQITSSRR